MDFGNVKEDSTICFKFTTRKDTGLPTTLAGTPAVKVYIQGSTTEVATGVTLSVDYDSVTGLNDVTIDLSASASYVVGKDYDVVITAGTVDSVSVIGEVVAHFRIEKDTAWDFLRASHNTANTFGEVTTAADIAAAVRDVNNATPAADSLGEAVNDAATGGGGGGGGGVGIELGS